MRNFLAVVRAAGVAPSPVSLAAAGEEGDAALICKLAFLPLAGQTHPSFLLRLLRSTLQPTLSFFLLFVLPFIPKFSMFNIIFACPLRPGITVR